MSLYLPGFIHSFNPNYMDGSHLRVASFSSYLDSAEESFVPKLTEGVPVLQADRGLCGIIQFQPGINNVEQFSFPVLNSRIEDLKVKKHVIAEIALQGNTHSSVGSGMTKKDDIAVKLARKLSRLTWDAIPSTQSRSLMPASSGSSSWCDDTASYDSSDLFEIENTSSTRCSMLSRQEPSASSKTQNSVKASAAEKSLTVSDDNKRDCNCVGDRSSTYRTTKPKHSCKFKSGARWLLGCKSSNAVRIAENTSRIRESAKVGKK